MRSKSLSHNLPQHQTESNDYTLVSDHFPSALVEEDQDIRSRSQLSKEQHKDPEISPLFKKKAVSKTDLAQNPICFYIKNEILKKNATLLKSLMMLSGLSIIKLWFPKFTDQKY